jgi:hypothetical protein
MNSRKECTTFQLANNMIELGGQDAYTLWAATDEHDDAFLDDVQLPLLLPHCTPQPSQLRLCHLS